jgi:hypothetical protein
LLLVNRVFELLVPKAIGGAELGRSGLFCRECWARALYR